MEEHSHIDSIGVAVELARELCPDVVLNLMTLVKQGSPDIQVKAARALIAIMSIDRSRMW
jgi:hypothetical protein